mgnify:CR=1 FL=1
MTPVDEPVVAYRSGSEHYTDEGCFIVELLGVGHDARLSVARARVEPGGITRLHRLVGVEERYVILSGEGVVEVGEHTARRVGPMDVVRIPPGIGQRIRNIGREDLVFLCLCTPPFVQACYEEV